MTQRSPLTVKIDTSRFADFCRRFAMTSRQSTFNVLRKIVFQVLRKIIFKWPVLTGRSRAGWGVATELVGLKVPSPPKPEEAAKGFVPGDARFQGQGQPVVMFQAVNNVAYAPELEEGSSAKAPLGAVRVSLLEVQADLSGSALPADLLAEYKRAWDRAGAAAGTEIRSGIPGATRSKAPMFDSGAGSRVKL